MKIRERERERERETYHVDTNKRQKIWSKMKKKKKKKEEKETEKWERIAEGGEREILILGDRYNKRWEKSGEEEKFEGENKGWEFSMLQWPIMSTTTTSYRHVMIAWPAI